MDICALVWFCLYTYLQSCRHLPLLVSITFHCCMVFSCVIMPGIFLWLCLMGVTIWICVPWESWDALCENISKKDPLDFCSRQIHVLHSLSSGSTQKCSYSAFIWGWKLMVFLDHWNLVNSWKYFIFFFLSKCASTYVWFGYCAGLHEPMDLCLDLMAIWDRPMVKETCLCFILIYMHIWTWAVIHVNFDSINNIKSFKCQLQIINLSLIFQKPKS